MSERTFLTKEGYDKLREELRKLKGVGRIEAANNLETARAHGDLRENAEYDTAKQEKAKLEARIQTLEEKLATATVVENDQDGPTDKIYFGTAADLKNLKTGDKLKFIFVAQDEADITKNKISITSPIGKALLGHKVGERVEVKIPAGTISYEILKIERA